MDLHHSVGNKDDHKSLDEFEFLPGPITNYLECLKMNVKCCEHSITFIFDWLVFMKTTIKSWMGLKLGKVIPGTAELAALKNPLIVVSPQWMKCCDNSGAFIF